MTTPDKPTSSGSSIAPPRRVQGPPAAGSPIAPVGLPPKPITPGVVTPVVPVGAVKPVVPVSPVTPMKPTATGGVTPVTPVRPIVPGATTLPVASAPGKSPLKPVTSTSAGGIVNPNKGTAVVKAAPPKETARITVKPSLPGAVGGRPAVASVKPAGSVAPAVAAGAVAGAAVAAATNKMTSAPKTPVTTTPKTTSTPAAVSAPSTVRYQEEPAGSTMMTTVAAGVLALLTWGTAGVLFASVFGYL